MRTRTILILAVVLIPFAAGCLEMDGFLADEERVDTYKLPGNTIPQELIEPVMFESGGRILHGFWISSSGLLPRHTILYCHGNKHHIDEYWDRVMLLHETGVNVFIFDYSGFGRSEGSFSEEAMLADADAALEYVLARPEVASGFLGIYGYSLGNVASIHLAADIVNPLFLIAEAPFASANSLVQSSTNLPIPARWLTEGTFDNEERIRRIQTSLLVIHGEDDDFVRLRDNGRLLFEAAPEPKASVWVPGARHSDIPDVLGHSEYVALIEQWIALAMNAPPHDDAIAAPRLAP